MSAVSIVIPVYNSASYLHACFASIQMQTLRDFEVILVDDASTDASQEICRDQCRRDSRFQLLCLEQNSGSGPARNKGLEQAQGDYVLFCDADDAYTPNALKTLYESASHSGTPVSGGNIAFMDNSLSLIAGVCGIVACTQFWAREVVSPWSFPPLWMPIYHPRYMIAAGFLRAHDIRYPALLRGQDPPFLAHVLCHAGQVAVCPEVVYLCRGARLGEKKLANPQAFQDHVTHYEKTFAIFMEHGARKQALFFLAQALANILAPKTLLCFTGKERQQLLSTLLPLAHAAGEALYQEDYAPYTVNTLFLKRDIALLKKGLSPLLIGKIVRKIKKHWFS